MTRARILKGIFQGDILEVAGYAPEVGAPPKNDHKDRLIVVITPKNYKRREFFYYLPNNVEILDKDEEIIEKKSQFYLLSDPSSTEYDEFTTLGDALTAAKNEIVSTNSPVTVYISAPIYKIERSVVAKVTKL